MKNLLVLLLLFASFNAHARKLQCNEYLYQVPRSPVFSESLPADIYNGSIRAAERFVRSEDVNRSYEMSFLSNTMLVGQSPKYTHKEMLAFLLSESVEKGRVEVVRALLKSPHIDLNSNLMSTYPPLFQAVAKSDFVMVKLLLGDSRIDVSYSPIPGMSVLAYAVKRKHVKMVEVLVADGRVDVNSSPVVGKSLLAYAVDGGSVELVKLLLASNDIEVNQLIRSEIYLGGILAMTTHPLVVAIQKDSRVIFDLLLSDKRTNPSGLEGSVTTPLIESTKVEDAYYKRKLLVHPDMDLSVRDARGHDIAHHTRTKAEELELKVPLHPAD